MKAGKIFTALCPMKGESERLIGKNMRQFLGRPLCHRILDTLTKCPSLSEVIVDTDSEVIKSYVKTNFPTAKVIDRPVELTGQLISIEDVIRHDVSCSSSEFFFQTFATCPLLSSNTILKAIDEFLLDYPSYDSMFSVSKIQKRLYWPDGTPVNPSPGVIRNQDLTPIYERNAGFFIFSRDSFFNNGQRIGQRPKMYLMEKLEAIDIDHESDFIIAEVLAQQSA